MDELFDDGDCVAAVKIRHYILDYAYRHAMNVWFGDKIFVLIDPLRGRQAAAAINDITQVRNHELRLMIRRFRTWVNDDDNWFLITCVSRPGDRAN